MKPLTLDLATTAVIVVDMQNGFCHAEGDLGKRGQGETLRAIVPAVADLVTLAHRLRVPVFWSHQEHDPDDVTRSRHRIAPHTTKQGHLPCLRGTWDAELVEPLRTLAAADHHFVKHRASCFYATTLEVGLRMRGIDTLVVAGVTTNYCVDSTVRDAYARDFDVVVVGDCCAALHRDLHDATLRNVELYHGTVMTLERLRAALGNARPESGFSGLPARVR